MYGGMSVFLTFTRPGVCVTVFPFIDPKSGPNMSSALAMSDLVTGQFESRLLSKIHSILRLFDLPIILCNLRAK
jgi:hypothetical protein